MINPLRLAWLRARCWYLDRAIEGLHRNRHAWMADPERWLDAYLDATHARCVVARKLEAMTR